MKSNGNENNFLEKLSHIANILEERVFLYEKRLLEVKRAVKAYHRATLKPNPIVLYNLLEAKISFIINTVGYQIIKEIILSNSMKQINEEINAFISSNKELFLKFERKIESTTLEFGINRLSRENIQLFYNIVFSLDENFQRKTIKEFLVLFAKPMLQNIFVNMVILDESFTRESIDSLIKYLH